jgi:hypothetical protein
MFHALVAVVLFEPVEVHVRHARDIKNKIKNIINDSYVFI